MGGEPRDTTVRNVWVGAAVCLLAGILVSTVLPSMMQQALSGPQGPDADAYRWAVTASQILSMALFPFAAVLAGVGIILGWMRKNLRKAPRA